MHTAPTICLVCAGLGLLACVAPTPADDSSTTAAITSTTGESESGTDPESGTETGTDSGTETGPACTGEVCSSTLTISFAHTLPLLDGPHRFYIDTPEHSLTCSVDASASGSETCFGFAFADLSWTEELVTVLLTNPFSYSVDNPDAAPFAAVQVQVERGDEVLWMAEVPVEPGEAMMPDPCGGTCWQATAAATIE